MFPHTQRRRARSLSYLNKRLNKHRTRVMSLRYTLDENIMISTSTPPQTKCEKKNDRITICKYLVTIVFGRPTLKRCWCHLWKDRLPAACMNWRVLRIGTLSSLQIIEGPRTLCSPLTALLPLWKTNIKCVDMLSLQKKNARCALKWFRFTLRRGCIKCVAALKSWETVVQQMR